MILETKELNVGGDILSVYRDEHGMWVSPCNGVTYPSARQAMRAELSRYLSDCGELSCLSEYEILFMLAGV